MTRHAASIRLHRLIPTPYTLHADWRPDTPASSANQKQMLEITSSHQNPLSICVEQHRCTSRPLPPETVMITASTCTILHVGAGDEVHVAPITLHKVCQRGSADTSKRFRTGRDHFIGTCQPLKYLFTKFV